METTRDRAAVALTGCAVALVIGVAIALAPEPARGAGTQPARDDEVLARVAARPPGISARRELARTDLRTALALARSEIDSARASGDPRPLGHAEALLAPWLAGPEPPLGALVFAATVAQSLHRFDEALLRLDQAAARAPDDVQIWLTRASVLSVRGRYPEARQSCEKLAPHASLVVATACSAPIDALTGRARLARTALREALVAAGRPAEQAWLHSLLGELAFWAGDLEEAERELTAALARDPSDRYTRGLYADLLLDTGRPAAVLSQLAADTEDDAMLLRRALAAQALGDPAGAALATRLRERFSQAQRRGDFVHQREHARLLLASRGEERATLASARRGFAEQREPWDVRVLLEAAVRCGDAAAARPALDWLSATGFESPRLRALAERLRRQQ